MEENKESVIMELQENELTEMISINVICRLCANQNDKLIGIYSEDGISNDLANKMNLYLPVKVNETDDLPLQCCWQCASTVLAWHDLVVTSVEADRRLRSYQFVTEKQLENVQVNFQTEENILIDKQEECESIQNYMANSGDIKLLYLQIKTKEKLRNLQQSSDNRGAINAEVDKTSNNGYEKPIFSENPDNTNTISKNQIDVEERPEGGPEEGDKHVLTLNQSELSTNIQCEICEKLISSKANYLNHIKIHTTDFYCKMCCNSYTSQYKLNLHLSQHPKRDYKDGNTEAYIKCEINGCDNIFPSKLQLFNHKKAHLNIKELVCNICDAKFIRKSALDSHEKRHVVLTCAVCEKKFANKKTLKEHERLHTGELPFQCKQCDKKFRCHSGLKYHEAKHSSEKRFRCNHCNLSFGRSNYLKEHLRRHLNEKPYSCDYCKSKFVQKNVLKRHISSVHRNCDICKCMIGNVRDYRAHIYTEHNVILSNSNDK